MARIRIRYKELNKEARFAGKDETYTDCQFCHNSLTHCSCTCPYCGKRDSCDCALFDATTGG